MVYSFLVPYSASDFYFKTGFDNYFFDDIIIGQLTVFGSIQIDVYKRQTIEGIYPIGEGAGYAGGIMSSAVDGAEAANKIAIRYRKGFKEE